MRHLKFGVPILSTAAILLGLSGCADENHWGSSSDQKGSISLVLSTDPGINTAKPVFRSGDDDSASDPNDLNTYIEVPTPEQFSIKLEKSDESFSKTWTSLQGFLDYTKQNFFSTGAYTLTAYYGEKGKQDFEAPYFEASSTFNVLSDEVYELNLVAELKNSMVKVNYTDGFKDYMSDYHSRIRTEGRADEIVYSKEAQTPVFLEPNNAVLTLHFTTKGKGYTSQLKIGEFPPIAKTLHNITLDIIENDNGYAQLGVTFDDTLDEEKVTIDLTEELLTSAPPVITCKGFEDGATLEMLEGSASQTKIEMIVNSSETIKSAKMTVESSLGAPSWGQEIDLCAATPEQIRDITAAGIDAIGFGFTSEVGNVAVLDLTNYGRSLSAGVHKISLEVSDIHDKVSNVSYVVFDSQLVSVSIVGTPTIPYCGNKANVTIDYNGLSPLEDISFRAIDDKGNPADVKVLSCEENTATRAIENKQYVFEIELPSNVTASRALIPFKVYHGKNEAIKEKASFDLDVIIPEYDLTYDAFATHAYIKVILKGENDPNIISNIIQNILIKVDDIPITSILRETEKGYFAIEGLSAGGSHKIETSITNGETYNENTTLTTETEEPIPNGDFSEPGGKLESETLLVGGDWYATNTIFTSPNRHYSSFSYDLPKEWSTINHITAPSKENVTNYNTWYVVPSSWTENGIGIMRNVGYSHNGKQLGDPKGTHTDHYCRDHPEDSDLDKAAGVLSLGDYDFSIGKSIGVDFRSRPSKITFHYEYNNDPNKIEDEFKDDIGYAYIELYDISGNSLGAQEFDIEKGEGNKTISFEQYGAFQTKAGKLKIVFKSSKNPIPPIHIPSGNELSEGDDNAFDISNKTFPPNTYHAVATGSVLKISNVKAHYDSSNSQVAAPKRTNKKKR